MDSGFMVSEEEEKWLPCEVPTQLHSPGAGMAGAAEPGAAGRGEL